MDNDIAKAIRNGLQDSRREALNDFSTGMLEVLIEQGFSFEDFVDSLASWAYKNDKPSSVVSALENVARNGKLYQYNQKFE